MAASIYYELIKKFNGYYTIRGEYIKMK